MRYDEGMSFAAPPPPAPPVCSVCNAIIGARSWMAGDRLLCDGCGSKYKPGLLGRAAKGPFVNDRSSVGTGETGV
jgi:hypothetical protein